MLESNPNDNGLRRASEEGAAHESHASAAHSAYRNAAFPGVIVASVCYCLEWGIGLSALAGGVAWLCIGSYLERRVQR